MCRATAPDHVTHPAHPIRLSCCTEYSSHLRKNEDLKKREEKKAVFFLKYIIIKKLFYYFYNKDI
jgi:hypothetical protein